MTGSHWRVRWPSVSLKHAPARCVPAKHPALHLLGSAACSRRSDSSRPPWAVGPTGRGAVTCSLHPSRCCARATFHWLQQCSLGSSLQLCLAQGSPCTLPARWWPHTSTPPVLLRLRQAGTSPPGTASSIASQGLDQWGPQWSLLHSRPPLLPPTSVDFLCRRCSRGECVLLCWKVCLGEIVCSSPWLRIPIEAGKYCCSGLWWEGGLNVYA